MIAVAAAVWLLGIAAGCHLSHAGFAAPQHSSASAAHVFAEPLGSIHADADCCWAGIRDCTPVMHSWWTTGLAALAVTVAVLALAGWSAAPVPAPMRGPPRPVRTAIPHTGRNILTRICISRR
ncbi:hypothetical protein BST29_04800 [Mycobacterium malmoense]|uniref:Lipoprotein LpqS n=1 Tax=Mycobacterium malmoense TaxID=1780 RepID=A0ABX3SYN3_MYCMA|nr:hypothetical protein BST29_04800 [Mycobacterium malmoense]